VQFVSGGNARTKLTSAVDFSGRCSINIRGRASLRYPKNSFSFKRSTATRLRARVDSRFSREADWVLYAPYPDKTLMRDVLAYELHAQMGYWARARSS